jgi:predicted PurR-regulated permease PerM
MATLVFAYFTEVFIEIFTSLKDKMLKNIEKNSLNKSKFFGLIHNFVKVFHINLIFVYSFYFIFSMFLIFFILIPIGKKVFLSLQMVINKIPLLIDVFKAFLINLNLKYNIDTSFLNDFGKILNIVLENLIKFFSNFLLSFKDWLFIVLVPIFGIYFYNAKKDFFTWLDSNFSGIILSFFKYYDYYQKIYVKAILTNIFTIIILSSIVFTFLLGFSGIEFGVLYGLFSFIPVVGPIVGSLPVIIFSFSKSIYLGFVVLFFVIAIQQFADNFITPKTVEKYLALNPFLSIVSILAFYLFFGVWSVFLAIPLALTLKSIIEEIN